MNTVPDSALKDESDAVCFPGKYWELTKVENFFSKFQYSHIGNLFFWNFFVNISLSIEIDTVPDSALNNNSKNGRINEKDWRLRKIDIFFSKCLCTVQQPYWKSFFLKFFSDSSTFYWDRQIFWFSMKRRFRIYPIHWKILKFEENRFFFLKISLQVYGESFFLKNFREFSMFLKDRH